MSGMFDHSKTVEDTKPAKGKKSEPLALYEIPGMMDLAAMESLKSTAANLVTVAETVVRSAVVGHFIADGIETKARPKNFRGVEPRPKNFDGVDKASGAMQLRMRGEKSPLNEDEVKALTKRKIPTKKVVTVPETFIIDPEHVKNEAYLKIMEEALAPLMESGVLPKHLFKKQEEKSVIIADEGALEALFARYNKPRYVPIVAALLPMISTVAVASKATKNDLGESIAVLQRLHAAQQAADAAKKLKEEAAAAKKIGGK